jgi:predicted RNase H-like nuclease (RuvC/YqgF family)
MRWCAAVLLVVALVAACGSASEPAATSTPEGSRSDAPTTSEVVIVERAASQDVAELESQVASLERDVEQLAQALAALAARPMPSVDTSALDRHTSALDRRVQELERQVGVTSLNKKSLSNLWSEVSSLASQVGGEFGITNGLEHRVRSLESCVDQIIRSWSSDYTSPRC